MTTHNGDGGTKLPDHNDWGLPGTKELLDCLKIKHERFVYLVSIRASRMQLFLLITGAVGWFAEKGKADNGGNGMSAEKLLGENIFGLLGLLGTCAIIFDAMTRAICMKVVVSMKRVRERLPAEAQDNDCGSIKLDDKSSLYARSLSRVMKVLGEDFFFGSQIILVTAAVWWYALARIEPRLPPWAFVPLCCVMIGLWLWITDAYYKFGRSGSEPGV
jgi:hypothetical protein